MRMFLAALAQMKNIEFWKVGGLCQFATSTNTREAGETKADKPLMVRSDEKHLRPVSWGMLRRERRLIEAISTVNGCRRDSATIV